MLKIMVLRKRHKKMLEDAATLRAQLATFKTRETDLAAQVEAATTDEEIAAAAAAVSPSSSPSTTYSYSSSGRFNFSALIDISVCVILTSIAANVA